MEKLRTVAEDREFKVRNMATLPSLLLVTASPSVFPTLRLPHMGLQLGEVERQLAAKEAHVSELRERTSEVQIELKKRDEALAKERALVYELQRRVDSNYSNFSGGADGAVVENSNDGDNDDDGSDDSDDEISMRELELEEPASDSQEEERKGEETDAEDKSYDSPGESSAYIAAFDFEADPNDPNQMVLAPGDELRDVKDLGGGWSKGMKSRTMQRGVFPTSFILPVEALLPTEVFSPTDNGASASTASDDRGGSTISYGDDSSHMVPVEMDSDTDSAQPSQGSSVAGSLKLKPLRRPGKKEATTPQKRRTMRSLRNRNP